MKPYRSLSLCLLVFPTLSLAQDGLLPPGEPNPILRLETTGPTAQVTALAFSPDGKRLYAAGFDKLVRSWSAGEGGRFVVDRNPYRVPVGPGLNGVLNALALSPDGKRLAVAGQGLARNLAGFRTPGLIRPVAGGFSRDMRLDQGLIFVFNTDDHSVRILRGHAGPVRALAFVPAAKDAPHVLASAAMEWNFERSVFDGGARLWDADTGKELAQQSGLPELAGLRPDIAPWRTGNQPRDVRVGLAWGDKTFRVWDAAAGRVSEKEHREYGVTVAWLQGRERLLTATYGGTHAQLHLWDGNMNPTLLKEARGTAVYPLALAVLGDHAAVVVRVPARNNEHRLQLFALGGDEPGKLVFDGAMWDGSILQPVLATSADGKHLAVAGHPDQSILVWSTQDLVEKRDRAVPQELRSEGETFRTVAFARKGEERGLALSRTSKANPGDAPRGGDWLFNVGRREVDTKPEGWKLDVADSAGWSVRLLESKPRVILSVSKDEREQRRVTLPDGHVVQDWVLLPPRGDQPALLAVASFRLGEPRLIVYDATTGEQLRHFTGHTGLIYSVAFSSDGKLLTSVAQDQTVCVWSLAKLDRVLGKIGLVPGLAVRASGELVVVARVETDSPARGLVEVDETVEGVVDQGQLKKVATPVEFYDAITARKPGDNVVLRVAGRDVTIKVGQGIDERKPLFTLFVTREGKGKPEWVGFSPLGPYEMSGRAAEDLLVWHVNTGKVEGPTQVVAAEQYRKQFLREGVLSKMLERGELPPDEKKDLPRPRMTLLIDEDVNPRAGNPGEPAVVRQGKVNLRINVADRPVSSLSALFVRVDSGAEQPIDRKGDDDQQARRTIDVPRGRHTLRVRATYKEAPAETEEVLEVRYQPPAPRVTLEAPEPGKAVVVMQPGYVVKAKVTSGAEGEAVQVSLVHRYQGKELLRTPPIPAAESPSWKINLEPGSNGVEVIARNRDRLEGHEELETTTVTAAVSFRKKDAAPTIALKRIVPLDRPASAVQEVGSGTLVVDTPKVRIEGDIVAQGELTAGELIVGDRSRALGGLDRKHRLLDVAEVVELVPGEQRIRVTARTATSDPAEASVVVAYRPRLPIVTALRPDDQPRLVAGKAAREIVVEADLQPADNKHPYRAIVLVNGVESKAAVKPEGNKLSVTVPLDFGLNRLQLRLSNNWKTSEMYGPIEVSYVRPPLIVGFKPMKVTEPQVDVEVKVKSALPLLKEAAGATLGELSLEPQLVAPDEGEDWLVRLRGVRLDPGVNVVRLTVANREAMAEPAELKIEYQKPEPPPKPVVRIEAPGEDGASTEAEVELRFRITSKAALTDVEVVREEKPTWRTSLDPTRLKRDGDDYLSAALKVPLVEGQNTIHVEASNPGGKDRATRSISLAPPPVRVEVLKVIPAERNAKPLVGRPGTGGVVVFPTLPVARARIVGRVVFGSEKDERLQARSIVRIFVNDFQQIPATLREPEKDTPNVRTFETDVLLSRKEGNEVRLTSDLPGEKGRPVLLTADCEKPALARRLHLLLVSTRQEDPEALKKQFLDAIQAKLERGGDARSRAFEQIIVHDPQVGYFGTQLGYVRGAISRIRNVIQQYARSDSNSIDVVVFYFRGGETVNRQGHFFLPPGQKPQQGTLTCESIVTLFSETPGAHVLLFDVDRAGKELATKDQVSLLKELPPEVIRSHIAALRIAWLGEKAGADAMTLLRGLEKETSSAPRLGEWAARLETLTEQLRMKGEVLFDQHVTQGLKGVLLVGPK